MAKQFQFRFETMLKLRKRREDEQKRIVAERLRQIAQVREEIDSQERQIHEQTEVIRGHTRTGTIDLQQVMRNRHWLGHLHKGILEAQARIRFLEAKLSQERVQLAEAAKQRRVLEKLKERQQERYVLEQNRRETRELDEMATVRFVYDGK